MTQMDWIWIGFGFILFCLMWVGVPKMRHHRRREYRHRRDD